MHMDQRRPWLFTIQQLPCDTICLPIRDSEAVSERRRQEEPREHGNRDAPCEALAAPRKLRRPDSSDHIVE